MNQLIKECYFTFGNLLLLQLIEISMQIGSAPFWSNLHLYDDETAFIFDLIKTDEPRVIKFNNSSSLIMNVVKMILVSFSSCLR